MSQKGKKKGTLSPHKKRTARRDRRKGPKGFGTKKEQLTLERVEEKHDICSLKEVHTPSEILINDGCQRGAEMSPKQHVEKKGGKPVYICLMRGRKKFSQRSRGEIDEWRGHEKARSTPRGFARGERAVAFPKNRPTARSKM